jgi:hypothetical protein
MLSSWLAMLGLGLGLKLSPRLAVDTGGGGGGDYVAKAVQNWHFNQLLTEPVSIPDDPKGTLSYFIYPTEHSFPYAVIFQNGFADTFNLGISVESGWNGTNDVWAGFNDSIYIHAPDDGSGDLSVGERYHVFLSWDFDHPDGEKVAHFWINGVNVNPVIEDGYDALSVTYNGTIFGIPGSSAVVGGTPFGNATDPNGYANVIFWAGQTINPSGNLDKFRDPVTGDPVDPALAVAAFGDPDGLWSGDKTEFVVNQGTAGVSTLTAQPLFSPGPANNGAGPISALGIKAGTVISSVIRTDNSGDVTANFETIVTVDDAIQQLSGDLSMTPVEFFFVPYLNDRETA